MARSSLHLSLSLFSFSMQMGYTCCLIHISLLLSLRYSLVVYTRLEHFYVFFLFVLFAFAHAQQELHRRFACEMSEILLLFFLLCYCFAFTSISSQRRQTDRTAAKTIAAACTTSIRKSKDIISLKFRD